MAHCAPPTRQTQEAEAHVTGNFPLFPQLGYAATAPFRFAGSFEEPDGMKRLPREQSPPKLVIGCRFEAISADCVIVSRARS